MLVKLESYHDGDWCARGIGEAIFTQGKTVGESIETVKEALAFHVEDMQALPDVLFTLKRTSA